MLPNRDQIYLKTKTQIFILSGEPLLRYIRNIYRGDMHRRIYRRIYIEDISGFFKAYG